MDIFREGLAMKNSILRTAALLLSGAMLCSGLSGCGLRSEGSPMLSVSLDHSYASEKLVVDSLPQPNNVIDLGGKLLVFGIDNDYNNRMMLYDPADGSAKEVAFHYPQTVQEGVETYQTGSFLDSEMHLNVLFSGGFWLPDENGEEIFTSLPAVLETYDADMNLLLSRSLEDAFQETESVEAITGTPDGGYLVTMYGETGEKCLRLYDSDFHAVCDVSEHFNYISGTFQGVDGTLYVSYQDAEWNDCFGTIDPETGAFSPLTIEGIPSWFRTFLPSTDPQYDFYLTDTESLYGINCKSGSCTEVINWLNSDFIGNYIDGVQQLRDGRFLLTSRSMGADMESEMWLLTPRDPDAFRNVTMISMAGLTLPDELAEAVLQFNRTHDDARIAVVSYAHYASEDDPTAGMKKMQTDMTSGIVADLIITAGLPYESLANKGIFEDLSPYIADIRKEEYFTSLFDSMRYGDKLFHIGFSYDIQTLEGKQSVIGDRQGLSTSEFIDMAEALPPETSVFGECTREQVLDIFVTGDLKSYTDVATGTCHFNTPEFVRTLEYCSKFPAEVKSTEGMDAAENEQYWIDEQYQYINGKTALYQMQYNSIFNSYQERMTRFGEEEIVRLGFPTNGNTNGNGGRFAVYNTVAISSNSAVKDKCWEFMHYMLSEEYQNALTWSLPIKRSAFDRMAQEAMKPRTYIDEEGNKAEEKNIVWRGNEEVEIPPMPASYPEELKAYIDGITICSYYDTQIYHIIQEETAMFFSGDQSAQHTANMIQSRVSLYLAEQS